MPSFFAAFSPSLGLCLPHPLKRVKSFVRNLEQRKQKEIAFAKKNHCLFSFFIKKKYRYRSLLFLVFTIVLCYALPTFYFLFLNKKTLTLVVGFFGTCKGSVKAVCISGIRLRVKKLIKGSFPRLCGIALVHGTKKKPKTHLISVTKFLTDPVYATVNKLFETHLQRLSNI